MRNLLILASLATDCLIPGGSEDCVNYPDGRTVCDEPGNGPIEHYELDGTFCTDAAPERICLTVSHPANLPPSMAAYTLTMNQCVEHGLLSGGLEFQPSQPSSVPCLPAIPEFADIYSAAGEWTATGIRLSVNYSDGTAEGTSETTVLEMHYVP